MDYMIVLFLTLDKTYELPPGLLKSICTVESNLNPKAVHHDDGGEDSLGLCQVKQKTANWLVGPKYKLMNPYDNAEVAARYLQYQIKRYPGNLDKAIIAYNKGNAKGLTTSKYLRKVIKEWSKN